MDVARAIAFFNSDRPENFFGISRTPIENEIAANSKKTFLIVMYGWSRTKISMTYYVIEIFT